MTNNTVAEFAKRVEYVQQELASNRAELNDLRAELKANMIDKKAFAQAMKFANMGAVERAEYVANLVFYCECLGVKDFSRDNT